ncbi:MAG: rare lipoprotein A [Polaribacter sp.]|jgi:rare lipoprotein A
MCTVSLDNHGICQKFTKKTDMRYLTTFTFLVCLFAFNTTSAQSEEYGVASYYDDSFQDSKTASGEPYDKAKYTGAHKKLPFGTIVKITRLDTKASVKIRINDRGPYIKGRIIELSKKAATQIDLINAGVAKVKIEVLGSGTVPDEFANIENPSPARTVITEAPRPSASTRNNDKLTTSVKTNKRPTAKTVAPAEKPAPKATPPPPKKETVKPAAKPIAPKEPASRMRSGDFSMYDLYKVQLLRPERTGFGVQVASLTNYANVMKQVAELQEKWFKNILISVEKGKKGQPVYKILLGPFPDRATAKSYEKDLKRKKKIDGFIVALDSIKY